MTTELFGADAAENAHTPRSIEALATRQDEIGLSVYTLMEIQHMIAGACELVANGLLIAEQLRHVTTSQRRNKRREMSENSIIGYLWSVGALLTYTHEKIDAREREAVQHGIEQMITVMQGNRVAEPRGFAVMSYPSVQASIHEAVSNCLMEIGKATDELIRVGHAIASGRMEQALQSRGKHAS